MTPGERSAVVTGAASGIGQAAARSLVKNGWSVACVDLDEAPLLRVVAELRVIGRAAAVVGDVSDRRTHQKACAVAAELGAFAAWIGVAGLTHKHDLTQLSELDARRLIDVNQLGMLWGVAEAVRIWRERGCAGAIALTSSVHGRHAVPHHPVYEMTKAALEALVRSVAVTYGPEGIRAVAVAPGAVETPALVDSFATAMDPQAARRELERQTPAHRLAQPDEIAAAIAFLVSDQAAYISGTTLTVDGGMSAALFSSTPEPAAARPVAGPINV